MRLLVFLVLFVVVSSGCILALPPTRTELGAAWSGRSATRTRFATGAHLASAKTNVPVDVGVGLLYESEAKDDGRMNGVDSTTGQYLDVSYAVVNKPFARVFAGVRGERLRRSGEELLATKARIDAELFATSSGEFAEQDSCSAAVGGWSGRTGLGVYAEAGRTWAPTGTPQNDSAWTATVGLTARMPAFGAIVIGFCKNGRGGGDRGGSSGSGWSGSGGSSGSR